MADRKIIAYRLEPVHELESGSIATAAVMQCMATGEILEGMGGGGDFLSPGVVEAFRHPHSQPEQLERKHWPWLAQQLLDWPDRRTHPDKTMAIGALHRMAAGALREAAKPMDEPEMLGKIGAAVAEAVADQGFELSAPQALYVALKVAEAIDGKAS